MLFLKQSTAVILKMGPFVDATDGATAETGLSIAQGDIQISKNGGAFAQTSEGSPTTTHDADGWYPIPLTTTDTGTLGTLKVQVAMSGALPVWQEAMVLPANVYDSLVAGSDYLQIDVEQVDGDGPAAANLNAACDNYSATRGLAGTALPAAAADAAGGLPISDAGGLDVDAILADTNEIQSKLPAGGANMHAAGAAVAKSPATLASGDVTGNLPADVKAWDGGAVPTEDTTEYATAAGLTAAFTEIKGATWSSSTDTLEAIRDRGDVAWITATGFSTLDAAGVRTAMGLASANLDTQLSSISGYVDCLPASWVTVPTAAAVSSQVASDLATAHGAGSWATATGFSTHSAADVVTAFGTGSTLTAVGLASTGLDGVTIDSTINARQAMALMLAAAAGKLSGAAGTSITIKGADTTTTRIAATVDADGNRTAVTLTPPT